MIPSINNNQQNLSFEARFRLKKRKGIRMPMLFSSLGTWSTGAASAYGYGHYGNDVFKKSFYKGKIVETFQNVESKWLDMKNTLFKTIDFDNDTMIDSRVDGEIDDFKQGESGDCWLLSGLSSLRSTSWGRNIIKNSIIMNQDNTITVLLKGSSVNQKEFKITEDELQIAENSSKYSSGDLDVLAMELAVEKYRKSYLNKPLDSGGAEEIFRLLTGSSEIKTYVNQFHKKDIVNLLKEYIKYPDKYAIVFNSQDHAYALVGTDKDKNGKTWMKYANPWDSSTIMRMEYSEFIESIIGLTVLTDPTYYLRYSR